MAVQIKINVYASEYFGMALNDLNWYELDLDFVGTLLELWWDVAEINQFKKSIKTEKGAI